MNSRDSHTDSESVEGENASPEEGSLSQPSESRGSQTSGKVATSLDPKGRVFLTSRRTKKHVRITNTQPKSFGDAHQFVNSFEDSMKEGVDGIRKHLASLEAEQIEMEKHIASLEESLHRVTKEKEKWEVENKKLLQENASLKSGNKKLTNEIHQINTSHDSQLYHIADRHRKTRLAHKTLHKWKGKLKTGGKICLLEEENRKLKKELLACQEGAKMAFLRSANKLNSEALSMFQDSSRRQLDARLLPASASDRDVNSSCSSLGSDVSFVPSSASCDEPNRLGGQAASGSSPAPTADQHRIGTRRGESRHKRQQDFSDSEGHSSRQDENAPYDSEQYRTAHKRKGHAEAFSQSEKQKDATEVRHLPSFVSDPLRKETRQLMKQFQRGRPHQEAGSGREPKWQMCASQSPHYHVCHCSPLKDQGTKCVSCSPGQNFNLANMPIDDRASPLRPFNRPKTVKCTGSNVSMKKNVAFASTSKTVGRKSVFYKPTGSTVVVEKHISS